MNEIGTGNGWHYWIYESINIVGPIIEENFEVRTEVLVSNGTIYPLESREFLCLTMDGPNVVVYEQGDTHRVIVSIKTGVVHCRNFYINSKLDGKVHYVAVQIYPTSRYIAICKYGKAVDAHDVRMMESYLDSIGGIWPKVTYSDGRHFYGSTDSGLIPTDSLAESPIRD